ncbi:hypothetical protein [Candidatus Phytoplasma phoenicium]|uniref:Uncharacterized protein n=1 Tax=Candidatus Phytoplasma phoenicium TaxID=198422 RepID=A0A0L0MKG2_9MOLU|nr:hypothetical protein [Candidatus Phytoplasma phoenicium]KND62795.1 hypothetical protein AlmWB_00020 [Candidatus Phytoplasma phoenicium]
MIKLGCYNATSSTGLVLPLPQNTFHDIPIDAIYFDDGVRILPENRVMQRPKNELERKQELHQKASLEQEINTINKPYDEWLAQCEIKKCYLINAKYYGVDTYVPETIEDHQTYYSPVPFKVSVEIRLKYKALPDDDFSVEQIREHKNLKPWHDENKNIIFSSEKTQINGQDVYYIRFNFFNNRIVKTTNTGDLLESKEALAGYDIYRCYIESKDQSLSLTPPPQIINENSLQFLTNKKQEFQQLQQSIATNFIQFPLYTIEDLLKLSNGAKKIYLFSFNVQKREKLIELPSSSEPYLAIRDWKRENNLFSSPTLIAEGEYEEHFVKDLFTIVININSVITQKFEIPFKFKIISHCFETDHTDYILLCNDQLFKNNLVKEYVNICKNWLSNCEIKYSCYYTVNEIRNKFGRSSRWLYDENGGSHYYEYVKGIFFDDWYIDGKTCDRIYNEFLSRNRPPQKPKELD